MAYMIAIFHIGATSTHSHKVLRDHTVFLCGNPAISIKWMDLEDLMPLISKISQKLFVCLFFHHIPVLQEAS